MGLFTSKRKPGDGMRPNDARRPGVLPRPLDNRRQISPPANYREKIRGKASARRPGERNGEKRSGRGRTTCCARRPTLAGKLHTSAKKKTPLERTLLDVAIDAHSTHRHDCPHRATNGSLSQLPALIWSLYLVGEQPPGAIFSLPPPPQQYHRLATNRIMHTFPMYI